MTTKRKGGRPPAIPYHPNLAAKAIADYHEHDKIVKLHEDLRQDAFIRMLKSGLTTYQISKITGLADGSIRYWADATRTKRRRVVEPRARTVVEKVARETKSGSVLFGD